MSETIWTIKKLLEWAANYFTSSQIESPKLEAEILLAHTLGLKRIDLFIKFDQILTKDELAKFKGSIIRRKDHEPSAYITGKKAFMSLDFIVTKNVLIPRPETEILVETAVDILKNIENAIILDIGTGSGAISVSVAKYAPTTKISATDLSEEALKVATLNAKEHGVQDRIEFHKADLYPDSGSYDLIISNPPYIKTADIHKLQPEITKHEPIQALDGGENGMKYYIQIIENGKKYLKNSGYMILEIDPPLLGDINDLAVANNYKIHSIKKDIHDLDRAVILSSN